MNYTQAVDAAERLENKGLWRRANAQWLIAIDLAADEEEREKAITGRNQCARNAAANTLLGGRKYHD